MELEEKAAVAGAGKLKADQELTKVCKIHNKQQLAFIAQLCFPIISQQLQICRRTESKLAKALNEKAAISKELQKANETIEQYKQKV